jgi:hypothetical protein
VAPSNILTGDDWVMAIETNFAAVVVCVVVVVVVRDIIPVNVVRGEEQESITRVKMTNNPVTRQ